MKRCLFFWRCGVIIIGRWLPLVVASFQHHQPYDPKYVGRAAADHGSVTARYMRKSEQPGSTHHTPPHPNDLLSTPISPRREEVQRQQGSGQAPYSKTFRRYRIDLKSVPTPSTSSGRLLTSQWKNLPFVSDWRKASVQNYLDQTYGLEMDIRYIPLDPKDPAQQHEEIVVMAALWRLAADFFQGMTTTSPEHLQKKEEGMAAVFPEGLPHHCRVLIQWLDIFNWLVHTPGLPRGLLVGWTVEASYDAQPVPMIRLRRKRLPNVEEEMTPTTQPPSSTTAVATMFDPAAVIAGTQSWVQRILVDLSVCPFTKSVKYSGQGLSHVGVPVARIAYHTSRASTTELARLLADTWEAIRDMMAAGPAGKNGISSILLAAPAFDQDFDLWAGPIFAMLEASVMAARAEKQVGIVCFHPQYATPDGTTWPGFGQMHSVPRLEQWLKEQYPLGNWTWDQVAAGGAWQRRTPHATVNVLRADQLALAEGKRTTGSLYSGNIRTLIDEVGCAQLQQDLEREQACSILPPPPSANTSERSREGTFWRIDDDGA